LDQISEAKYFIKIDGLENKSEMKNKNYKSTSIVFKNNNIKNFREIP